MTYPAHRHREPESRLAGYLEEARALLARPPRPVDRASLEPGQVGPDFEDLRWFLLPEDVAGIA
jgi:hypothetical protein